MQEDNGGERAGAGRLEDAHLHGGARLAFMDIGWQHKRRHRVALEAEIAAGFVGGLRAAGFLLGCWVDQNAGSGGEGWRGCGRAGVAGMGVGAERGCEDEADAEDAAEARVGWHACDLRQPGCPVRLQTQLPH